MLTTIRRDVIEADVIDNTLKRPDLVASVQNWFELAHHDIQEEYDWRCMETTWETAFNAPGSVDGLGNSIVARYNCPDDLKTPILLYWYDKARQAISQFYNLTSIETLRLRRNQADALSLTGMLEDEFMYAIWANTIELYPDPSIIDANQVLRLDYYRWMAPPVEAGFDWFTTNARRFLQYRTASFSVLLTISDPRIPSWEKEYGAAYKKLKNADIAAKIAGSLIMRG
jgi:hypothetical protein